MGGMFEPMDLSPAIRLANRILMAPMTRNMAPDQTPTAEMAAYYAKRADAGLIVTEGMIIRPDSRAYERVPGIYEPSHIAGWRRVVEAVHAAGGKIFAQIWHVGRCAHPSLLGGQLPVSASETEMTGPVPRSNGLMYGKCRALLSDEIDQLVLDFAQAARNAREAGFDGIEIHAANGYLIDQFLHYDTNHRADAYGETPENMARFACAIVDACGDAIGFDRVAIRLSPGTYLNQIESDDRDRLVFAHLLSELNDRPIVYVHTGSFDDTRAYTALGDLTMTAFMRQHYRGNLVACGGYTLPRAEAGLAAGEFDLVAIGRPFIANPDLVRRLQSDDVLTDYDAEMLKTLV